MQNVILNHLHKFDKCHASYSKSDLNIILKARGQRSAYFQTKYYNSNKKEILDNNADYYRNNKEKIAKQRSEKYKLDKEKRTQDEFDRRLRQN